ncbi:fibronectin type III domain-containing protein [Paludibaculum fermentans]|uniref:fibronectin type III domain-containing protein n=1 Tax=Paludibaculum fermentans TaxID=1473598 RepID=UPI003EB88AC7
MRPFAALAVLTLALSGCGYVGDPKPPALDIPLPIQDLRGVQRGANIVLAFTPNPKTTEDILLKSFAAIDLRAGENIQGGFEVNRWAEAARKIPVSDVSITPKELTIPTAGFTGKEIIFAVRTTGPKGRSSSWSNLVTLRIVPTLSVPAGLTTVATAKGIYLEWKDEHTAPGTEWRVWRLAEGEKEPTVLGNAGGPSWLDPNAEFGKTYGYTLQQVLKINEKEEAESEVSPTASLKYEDKFAPGIPTGLTAVAGIKAVDLNWDRNQESDLKSYVVFRAEGGAALAKIADLGTSPNFNDSKVESGKKYRYAVAAVDELGNTSDPSAAVEIAVP